MSYLSLTDTLSVPHSSLYTPQKFHKAIGDRNLLRDISRVHFPTQLKTLFYVAWPFTIETNNWLPSCSCGLYCDPSSCLTSNNANQHPWRQTDLVTFIFLQPLLVRTRHISVSYLCTATDCGSRKLLGRNTKRDFWVLFKPATILATTPSS